MVSKSFMALALAGLATAASGKVCKVAISGNDMMQYDKSKLEVDSSCKKVELTLTHIGKQKKEVMGHNWVLIKKPDMDAVTAAALKAGPAKGFTPEGPKVLAATKMIGGGEKATVTFDVPAADAGPYMYICTFPGHFTMMKGDFLVAKAAPKKTKAASKKNVN